MLHTDTEYQKEMDARALAEAEAIKADPNRLQGAKVAAQSLAKEKADEARGMARVAGKSIRGIPQTNAPAAPSGPSSFFNQ